ncbi:MAG TPA: hypothetical protein VN833_17565, partial [Candidatus Acidoferrales bacterium]|nr:hypothetical protein [Candidatus Acidoferrales bacterium]
AGAPLAGLAKRDSETNSNRISPQGCLPSRELLQLDNVVRTIEGILGVNHPPHDANAFPCPTCLSKNRIFSYVALIPGILCEPPVDPTPVPECKNPGNRLITAAVKLLHDGAWWAQATEGFNFNPPDMINSDRFQSYFVARHHGK